MSNKQKQAKLTKSKGRFVSLEVNRGKSGVTQHSAKVQKVSENLVNFLDTNSRKVHQVPLRNVTVRSKKA